MELGFRGKRIAINRTLIMGILNVTPDSFSDGGLWMEPQKAAEHAASMVKDGADIIDIGAESTRPGSSAITAEEEIKRLIPVIKEIRRRGISIPISVDTYKSRVAGEALLNGADIINDISGGTFDCEMFKTAAQASAGFVIMHIKGTPQDMQADPMYPGGAVSEIADFFKERIGSALKAGLDERSIILDPGIGFGKTLKHNFEIIDGLGQFRIFERPLLVGTSRKSMIGKVLGADTDGRLFGTAASVALSIAKGADIVRVHDVKEIRDVVIMSDAILNYGEKEAKI